MCLFACDYSQKEVRILAHMSGDQNLISLFRNDPNVDIYKAMASIICKKSVDQISSKERAVSKQLTLAILYGMVSMDIVCCLKWIGPAIHKTAFIFSKPNHKLILHIIDPAWSMIWWIFCSFCHQGVGTVATNLSTTTHEAQKMMDDFFRQFRQLKVWMEKVKKKARENSYVETITGRKRYLDDINSDDNAKKSTAERQVSDVIITIHRETIALISLKLSLNVHYPGHKHSHPGQCSWFDEDSTNQNVNQSHAMAREWRKHKYPSSYAVSLYLLLSFDLSTAELHFTYPMVYPIIYSTDFRFTTKLYSRWTSMRPPSSD